ncbi:MAG: AAA family ATPase [Rhodocyclales bacterium]|nr:AAA family ATPase [Rhodocyclales bacterium]
MIKTLDVQNFTVLPNATWSFAPGLNVVVGENGLGKTHVLKLMYALLKVLADAKDLNKGVLERAYADKLIAVFRPESLGRLVKRRQGRGRCEFRLNMNNEGMSMAGAFASNAKSQIEILKAPTEGLARSPAYLPTRELVTLCPWFVPLYENYHLEFEETWRDTVSLLGNPSLKGPREKRAAELLRPLETAMGGKVQVDAASGRFYLQLPGEGRMEMPLVAEGLRKIAMLARLISTGTLLEQGYLFWDEPETNLNPKLVKVVAASIVAVAAREVQVFVASHSLFLLRELEMLLGDKRYQNLPRRWFALAAKDGEVALEQSDQVQDIQTLVMLDEELAQADRFMSWEGA